MARTAGIAPVLAGKRVLIVEDEAMIALTLETQIEDAGGEVVGPAHDLPSAIALADQPLDAAVLDINLHREKVFPLAVLLRERGVPFLFASANCDELDVPGGDFFGHTRIEKPLSMHRLVSMLADLVGFSRN